MITPQTYAPEWIEARVKDYGAYSYDLAEKMIHALALLEGLQTQGLNFIFKGGTALILLLEGFNRFSKDIDILMAAGPGNLTDVFDAVVKTGPFLRWEKNERPGDAFGVPKEHYKFFYRQTRNVQYPEEPVLLDIIFVKSPYPETTAAAITHSILQTTEPVVTVTLPTVNALLGDKLTAFAPATIGIPAGKGKGVEIAKQLFDLNLLFENVTDFSVVQQSFVATAEMVIGYCGKEVSVANVENDIIDTAFALAMGGKVAAQLFGEIRAGVTALNSYLSRRASFSFDKSVGAAAKMAYLAACFKTGTGPQRLTLDNATVAAFKALRIEHPVYAALNKPLKAGYPLAWLYWYHSARLSNT